MPCGGSGKGRGEEQGGVGEEEALHRQWLQMRRALHGHNRLSIYQWLTPRLGQLAFSHKSVFQNRWRECLLVSARLGLSPGLSLSLQLGGGV